MNFGSLFRQALILAVATSTSIASTASLAMPHAPAVAPVEVSASHESSNAKASTSSVKRASSSLRKKFAKISAAAICTEDLATISFREYPADWSAWIDAVSDRWSSAMDEFKGHHLKPSGPLFVEFTCNRDGTISEVIIDRSSGDEACDTTQIDALLRCSPLPAFPAESHKRNVTLLCIWSYSNKPAIVRATKAHLAPTMTRVSITGGVF